jgi:hypothetical protein
MNRIATIAASFAILAGLCAATAAGAPDPYTILDKHIAAIGGWEKLNAQQNVHFIGTLVIEGAGLQGTFEAWNQIPDKSRQEFDIKIIRQVSGDNGQIAWRVDQNGKLQIAQDSATLKERQLGALTATREQMKRDSKYFTVSYDRSDTADGKPCFVIKTTNTINSYVFYDFYDTTSYLLIKDIVIKPDGETHAVNKDFRDIGGVLYPFTVGQMELPTSQRTTITFSSIEVNQPMAADLFEPPSEQKRDFRFPQGKNLVEVPFQFIELHLFLPLTINGKTKLWILDSGAGVSLIDKEFADTLGLKQEGKIMGQGANTTAEFSFTTLPPFELNGLAFDSQKVAVFAINEIIKQGFGFEVGGILGYDFLSRLVTKVDFAAQMLTFYNPETFSYTGDGVSLDAPISKDNMFRIPITIDDTYTGSWDLDLGASGLNFHYPFAAEKGLLTRPGVERMSMGAGGGQVTKTCAFTKVTLAGFTKSQPLVDIPMEKGKGAFSKGDIVGTAGNDLFRHFTLYLDYKHQKVIVEKGGNFDKVFPRDQSGLQIMVGKDGQIEILTAAAGTPATTAGLMAGDKIVAINGKTADACGGIMGIKEMFRAAAGTAYAIDLIRNGKPQKVNLTLRDLYK